LTEGDVNRTTPEALLEHWETATRATDPLEALGASSGFWEQWARWQGTLVAEALKAGATWEQIGKAMGTSRQAAWARFRTMVEGDAAEAPSREQLSQARHELREQLRELHRRVRQREESWRSERAKALAQVRIVDGRRSEDRVALREQMISLRHQFRELHQQARGTGAVPGFTRDKRP
jgi:hypothetical protein